MDERTHEQGIDEVQTESRDEMIERLLAKADVDFKCCGSHCSNVACHGEGG